MSEGVRHGLPETPMARVATMLTPDERLRVDAAGLGWIEAYHRESVEDVRRDLRSHRARALILSTAMCQRASIPSMAQVVREFPGVPTVALLSQADRATVKTVLSLGHCGIRTLIDVREPTGWRELRTVLLSERATDLQRLALARLDSDLAGATAGTRRFFRILFGLAARTTTVRQLCAVLDVGTSTFMSRFFRARLPPPKRLLAYARLACAARLFENPGVAIAGVAVQLGYSSPQSFSRHVRSVLHVTPATFRERYDGEGMLECFRAQLVLPHLERWRRFDPFADAGVTMRRAAPPDDGSPP